MTEDSSASSAATFYDRAYSRWLPVRREAVSPDGRRYAYTEATHARLHLIDVATGVDNVLYSGLPFYSVVDFQPEGIYLTVLPYEGYGTGLWIESTAGGSPRLISRSIRDPVITGRVAWGLGFNPADPHPAGGEGAPLNELTHVDMVTAVSTSVFYRPGTNLAPLGVDQSGALIVGVFGSSGSEEVWMVASATVMRELGTFTSVGPLGIAAIDRHGAWYTGGYQPSTVWLYAGGAFRDVAIVNALAFTVAGGCIP